MSDPVAASGAGTTPRRASRWDRPPVRRDWRWAVGTVGKVLIATGVLMFGFVAYQLWGTGVEYAQAQDELDAEFEELLAQVTTTVPVTTSTTIPATTEPDDPVVASLPTATTAPATVAPTTAPAGPVIEPIDFQDGDVVARIEIPSIGLDSKVVQGVAPADLKRGPGHYPDTPVPGELGNAAIAGHRTTYGEPFADLDRVAVGDEIIVTTVTGRFVYRMTGSEIVSPSASEVVATTDPTVATLTLTTCHPRWTARQRLILFSELDLEASAAPQEPPLQEPAEVVPTPTAVPATLPGGPVATTVAGAPAPTTVPTAATEPTTPAAETPQGGGASGDGGTDSGLTDETVDAFAQGWFSDDGAFAQVALWGLLLTAIAVGAYLLSRATRRNWVGALAGIVPFVVVLYFFFQNVNRLLPAAL